MPMSYSIYMIMFGGKSDDLITAARKAIPAGDRVPLAVLYRQEESSGAISLTAIQAQVTLSYINIDSK